MSDQRAPLEARHDVERHFHDRKAQTRSASDPHDFYGAGGLDAVWRAFLTRVGPLTGKTILDFGCGEGWAAAEYARRGAIVHSFDISVESLRKVADTRIHPAVMAAEYLGYKADSFDLVLGVGILHHTELPLVSREVARVLRPAGRALFMEPLAHNPFLRLFRALTPGRRTPTEQPMTLQQIRDFARGFGTTDVRGYHLVSILPQGLLWMTGNRTLFRLSLRLSEAVDRWLLPRWRALQRYCWCSIIEVRK
jgi:SAM-dependent methyltransferase